MVRTDARKPPLFTIVEIPATRAKDMQMLARLFQISLAVLCAVQVSPLRACSIEHVIFGLCCHDEEPASEQDHPPCPAHDGPCVCKLDHSTTKALNPTPAALQPPALFSLDLVWQSAGATIAAPRDEGPPSIRFTPLLN
jgi:hypothetical protein